MTTLGRQMVYVPDALVKEAREKGMANLSKFVREALKEYIDTGAKPSTANPGSTSKEGKEC